MKPCSTDTTAPIRVCIQALLLSAGVLTFTPARGGQPVPSEGIRIDSGDALRTADAVLNPTLTREEALEIADLPANQGLIEQAREFGTGDTRETFADKLLAEARGQGQETVFNFDEVRRQVGAVRIAVRTVQANPAALTDWIAERIAPFAPEGVPIAGVGYLQAGGPGGGFSNEGRVYVNLARSNGEMGVVRVTLAHEIYHGIQHAAEVAAGTQAEFDYDPQAYAALPSALSRSCYATRRLFGSLMKEATASYVGDVNLLPTSGAEALSERKQRDYSVTGRVTTPITLLEIGVAALTSGDPVPEKQVYRIGFQQAGQLYYDIGYVMAKAIANHDGDAALGRLVVQPGDAFVRRYVAITLEPGSTLPKLGPNTVRWANRAGC
ncbi:DUF5700 domain-containing putative Zn-dependent protease [Novosphingobium terrae]|uniref:DUF5700 domain-containing putative Zn-dependent protease n=1 Tax=Novosphingobium terrae TaxID=2726189 RepID=UPI0019814537|nr:DUF5700 domain-containing putative Zn-dependent protease [Novosphingobium terrae]